MKHYSKSILFLFIVMEGIFSQYLIAQNPATGLLLITEPPATYIEAVEFVSIKNGTMYLTITLPSGETRQNYNSGLILKVNYPPTDLSTDISPSDAEANITFIRESIAKYPQHKAKLEAAISKWTNALELHKRIEKQSSTVNHQTSKLSVLQIEDAKFENVTLTSVNALTATITHESGVARISLTKITKDQVIALTQTSTEVQIDPEQQEHAKVHTEKLKEERVAKEDPISHGWFYDFLQTCQNFFLRLWQSIRGLIGARALKEPSLIATPSATADYNAQDQQKPIPTLRALSKPLALTQEIKTPTSEWLN